MHLYVNFIGWPRRFSRWPSWRHFLAALIGFGIGFGLGLWSGPGEFFSGVIAGTAAAKAVLVSGEAGTVTGGLIAYGLFKSNPLV